jgi:uncharacterized protein (UPF0264 family)
MRSIDPNLLLARVVAHEIGDLLLESKAHAAHGIMRAGLDVNGVGFYRFTEDQAAEMAFAVTLCSDGLARLLEESDDDDDRRAEGHADSQRIANGG